MSPPEPCVVVLLAPGDADPPALEPIADVAELHLVRSMEALEQTIADADVLAVYDFRTRWVHDLGERAGSVPWIHAASAGVDAVMTPHVVQASTVVTNARGVFDRPIAEYVLGVLLLFAKDLRHTIELQQRKEWRHRETTLVAGRCAVVVGAGSIGRTVAQLLRAAGLSVRGVARTARAEDPDFDAVVGPDGLHDELARADDVVVCAPLTAETRGLLDASALAAAKPGCVLVNVGRGPVVDQAALLDALRSGQVAAAALDVFEEEPLPQDHPFWEMSNVVVSPHMSGDVVGWRAALGRQLVENFQRWMGGEPLLNVIDKPAVASRKEPVS